MSAKEKDKKEVKKTVKKAPAKKASPKKTVAKTPKKVVKDVKKDATKTSTVKKKPIKKVTTKKIKEKVETPKSEKQEKFYQAVGRRKTSTSTVRLYEKKGGGVVINGKKLEEYFTTLELQKKIRDPLTALGFLDKFFVSVKVRGGGLKSQADAVRHGIGRAIVEFDSKLRKQVKAAGHLTRDPRMRERKKPGLKRARRAPQWRKR